MRKEYDFSRAKRASKVPHLAQLQSAAQGKTRITIMLDNVVIEAFRHRADAEGVGYQTLINRVLRETIDQGGLDEATLRQVIREELEAALR